MSTNPIIGAPAASRWRLEPSDSTATFRVPHFWGLVNVSGRFDRLDGWLEADARSATRLELTIDASSVRTGVRKRDAHLRGADFFDAQQHPEIRFQSTNIIEGDDGLVIVEGQLFAAAASVALAVKTRISWADDQAQVDATATVDHRQLGMTWSPLGMTRTPTSLTVHARLRKQS